MSESDLFDFTVVVIGIVGLFVSNVGVTFSVFRLLKILRILRLLKKAKNINEILTSFMLTLPSFSYLGIIVVVLTYIFSVIYNRIFALVKINGTLDYYILNF